MEIITESEGLNYWWNRCLKAEKALAVYANSEHEYFIDLDQTINANKNNKTGTKIFVLKNIKQMEKLARQTLGLKEREYPILNK